MYNSTPLVSVVLPIFNVERYLDQCVSSVLNQTYKNLEVILVDDGSEDSCPQKCNLWAVEDSRVKVIHKKNQGLGMARNSGIEIATGDYICFFDSDDYIDLDAIEQCVSRVVIDRSDFVLFGMRSVSTDGNSILNEVIPRCPKEVFEGEEIRADFLPFYIGANWDTGENWNLMATAWDCMIDRQLLTSIKFQFVSEREIISEDVYSMLGLFRYVRRVSVIGRAFYNYRTNPKSLTHVYRPDRLSRIKEFYIACRKLSIECGYSENVRDRLMEPYVSFVIAALKDLAQSSESQAVKRVYFTELANDSLFNEVRSKACGSSHFGWKRRLLLRLLHGRGIGFAQLLCVCG